MSDNGPQYSSQKFSNFAILYGFSHITLSPGHPSGNGEAERDVRTVEQLLKGAKKNICCSSILLQLTHQKWLQSYRTPHGTKARNYRTHGSCKPASQNTKHGSSTTI